MTARIGLRTAFLFIIVIAVLLWFSRPPMRIDADVARRIEPRMKNRDVEELIGGPPGYYDGVRQFQSDGVGPTKARNYRSWVDWKGEVRVYGNDDYVAGASFHPVKVTRWSPLKLFGQRLMRMQYSGYSTETRIASALAMAAVITACIAALWISVRRKNAIALQGVCGLLIGSVVGVLFFSFGWYENLVETTCLLVSPIAGALMGLAIGFIRWRCEGRPQTEDETDLMKWGEVADLPATVPVKRAAL